MIVAMDGLYFVYVVISKFGGFSIFCDKNFPKRHISPKSDIIGVPDNKITLRAFFILALNKRSFKIE